MMSSLKSTINDILINKKVRTNQETIMAIIPELLNEVGFEQRHPYHHLDVWKHTLLALDNLDTNELESNMALLLHDIGKPFCYQDGKVRHFRGHDLVSAKMARTILKKLDYDESFIENVCYLIKYHDTKIDISHLNSMDLKLLNIQYADIKAHHPNKVPKRLNELDKIKKGVINMQNSNQENEIFNNINSKEDVDNIINYYNSNENTKNKELDYLYLVMAELLPESKVIQFVEAKGGVEVALEYFNILEMAKTFEVPQIVCYIRLKTLEHTFNNKKVAKRTR